MSDGSSDGLRQMERTRRALEARIEELEEERDRIAGAFEADHHEQCSKRRKAERWIGDAHTALDFHGVPRNVGDSVEVLTVRGRILALQEQHRDQLTAVLKRAEKAERERDRLRSVCAEAYQMAGALDAPTLALDKLSAAARGKPIPSGTYLPVFNRWERRALAMHLQARRLRAGEEAALHCQAVEFHRYLRWRRRALALLEQVRRQRAYTGRVLRAMLAIHRDRQQQNRARNAWAERAMELALKVDADTDKE